MYIYPNTDIFILHNINLNNDYEHTAYFDTPTLQSTYFLGNNHVKYHLTNQSYQRKERGWMQVNLNQNDLWDCTYLAFRNTSYGTKWFYAFILSVEYINDNTSKINFEIDELQTWHFNYVLDKCFVEREHTESDDMFEHTLPENIDVGKEYYNAQIVRNFSFDCRCIMLITSSYVTGVTTDDPVFTPITPGLIGNAFSGLHYQTFLLDDNESLTLLKNTIKAYIAGGREDDIIALYQIPSIINQPSIYPLADQEYSFEGNFINIDGYIPKNNKLFTFPYNYLSVSDKEGQGTDYKWELWSEQNRGHFRIEATGVGMPCVTVIPYNYRDITRDRDNAITYNNFPVCSWAGDSYQIWLARNSGRLHLGMLDAGIQGGAAAILGDWRGMGDTYSRIMHTIYESVEAKHLPSKAHGDLGTSVLTIQDTSMGFEFKQMTIRNEYARIIDEYFSRFGYACHRIKKPNQKARQNWTYCKTIGCELNGNLPSDSIAKIKKIYDNGITWWRNADNIGNYGDFSNPTFS